MLASNSGQGIKAMSTIETTIERAVALTTDRFYDSANRLILRMLGFDSKDIVNQGCHIFLGEKFQKGEKYT
jgi:hypothetical protein